MHANEQQELGLNHSGYSTIRLILAVLYMNMKHNVETTTEINREARLPEMGKDHGHNHAIKWKLQKTTTLKREFYTVCLFQNGMAVNRYTQIL